MGLEKEILATPALTSIFGRHLVIVEKEEGIKKLGDHLKKVTIVVDYANEAFLPDEQLQFITKIIGACKMNLGDVAIVNKGRQALDFEKIRKELAPEKIILIGVDPTSLGLPMQFPDFKPQAFNGCVFLKASVSEIMNGESVEAKALKTQLWNGLKLLFQL